MFQFGNTYEGGYWPTRLNSLLSPSSSLVLNVD